MGWEPIATTTGVVLFGLLLFSIISSARKEQREEASRQRFFKAVEEARQRQIEGATQDRSISGVWKGEGTGFFGVSKRIEFRFNHSGSSISGQLKDDYGEAMLHGYFVAPFVMFDVRRDDTSFEFRGTMHEDSGNRVIEGKYRYSTTDADWSVKEVNAAGGQAPASQTSAVALAPKAPVEAQQSAPEASPDETPDMVAAVAQSTPPSESRARGGECPKCQKPLDANFEFCLYCGPEG